MQLTIRDVTQLLHVSESAVTRWIKQGDFPARRVSGQYHIHRADLLEWATVHKVPVPQELFDQPDTEAEASPTLADALQAGGIHYQLPSENKAEALRALVQVLPLPVGTDREMLLHLFLAREACASTAIGDGIAIPHVRNPIVLHVTRPMITLAFLAQPVDFGALDGKAVSVLFSIVSPTTRCHLQLLSRLSFALHDAKLRKSVMHQARPEDILREVLRVEAGATDGGVASGKAEV